MSDHKVLTSADIEALTAGNHRCDGKCGCNCTRVYDRDWKCFLTGLPKGRYVVCKCAPSLPEQPRSRFNVTISTHTDDGERTLDSPQAVRDALGDCLDRHGISEEIDYTLEVTRIYLRKVHTEAEARSRREEENG